MLSLPQVETTYEEETEYVEETDQYGNEYVEEDTEITETEEVVYED
jgi:hypothetical protein